MPLPKKSKAEKAATRSAVNARYRQKKEREGLKQVTLWVPAAVFEKIQGMKRVGIVVAGEDVEIPAGGVSVEYTANQKLVPLIKQRFLPGAIREL